MRVLIASTIVPFIEGGGTFIVDWLEQVLRERGHAVEVLKLPFWSHYRAMPAQTLALRLLDVTQHGDRLIAIRPPSYLLRHPAKVLWFIHHHRGAYDLWGTEYQDLPNTPFGLAHRRAIVHSDHLAFSEARSIFTNSAEVARRLKIYNDVDAQVLYPPVLHPERFHCGEYGDYILYVSRIAHHKRQELAVEAMRHVKTPVRLVIAGKGDEPAAEDRLRLNVERWDLSDRVTLLLKWISEEEKIELMSRCLGTIYIPFREDSYGYPSLEAHHAGKCVITTADAGGASELIVHGENGLITEPSPEALADAMDRLYSNRKLAQELGRTGVARIERLGITWDRVVERLLA
jgi:glycosyltransferase involved in cell wall biosynthesis